MKIKILFLIILSFCFLSLSDVLAETKTNIRTPIEVMGNNGAPFFTENLGEYIMRFLDIALIIGALACLMFLIMGGLGWVTSGGDKQKIEDARNKITSSIVGLAILASVFVIWQIVVHFFGLGNSDLLQINGSGGGGSGRITRSQCIEECLSQGNTPFYCNEVQCANYAP